MWTQKKVRQLRKLYATTDEYDLAKIIGVSVSMVRKQADLLGLEKDDKTASDEWSGEQLDLITRLYSTTPNKEIAKFIGKYASDIEHCAYRMGLSKSHSYFAHANSTEEESEIVRLANESYHKDMGVSRGHFVLGMILNYLFPNHKRVSEEPIGGLRIDWYIPHMQLAFEFDGIQHKEYVEFFHKDRFEFMRGQERDYSKSRMCEQSGIALVRIAHDEILTVGLVRAKIEEVI